MQRKPSVQLKLLQVCVSKGQKVQTFKEVLIIMSRPPRRCRQRDRCSTHRFAIQSILHVLQLQTPPRPHVKRTAGSPPPLRGRPRRAADHDVHVLVHSFITKQNEVIPTVSSSPMGVCERFLVLLECTPCTLPRELPANCSLSVIYNLNLFVIFDAKPPSHTRSGCPLPS